MGGVCGGLKTSELAHYDPGGLTGAFAGAGWNVWAIGTAFRRYRCGTCAQRMHPMWSDLG